MFLHKFGNNDIIYNRVKTYPRCSFFIYDAQVYYNNQMSYSGSFTSTTKNVPNGHISLYELNIDRDVNLNSYIYPFITKDGGRTSFKTISTTAFDNTFAYGDTVTSSYPLSASISKKYYQHGTSRKHITALKNTMNNYTALSDHYSFSSSLGDKSTQSLGLVSIPSIFYGSSIRKGSVSLKYYVTGTLVAELQDKNQNGELIQVSGTTFAQNRGSGSVAGVVLYDEGFLVLTGSWLLEHTSITRDYINDLTDLKKSSWQFFGVGANDGINPRADKSLCSASFDLSFEGLNYVNTVTMFAHADKGHLNHSNNPTYIARSQTYPSSSVTSSYQYVEESQLDIKNTMSSSYADPTASFAKQTYISRIGIYDDQRNLIGIASLATPVKKTEERDLTFKLKYDI